MNITNCKVNHLTNPLGYAMKRTVFSWTVEGAKGKKQKEARVLVNTEAEVRTIADSIIAILERK